MIRFLSSLGLAFAALLLSAPAFATAFGTLSNFDVVNDTPSPCHGFEIELEDLHVDDVPYTFGGTYIRYGTPEVLDVTVDPAHPRVLVRYRHWTGSQWTDTPVAPPDVTPGGHDCYDGGPIGNYESSGCEHYGVSLSANPTRTTYRWIVADDPDDINTTFSAVPQPVNLPVPVWDVIPNPIAGGGGVNVRAEVEPVEEENHTQFGEPQWMKAFKIESERDLEPDDLVKLLLGVADGIVPDDETEIETEWKLIQSKPGDAEDEEEEAEVKEDKLDDGNHSVIRRYEFYRYVGPRDPENNEADPCIHDDEPVPVDMPVEDCSDLGAFVGAQNVAVDIDLTAIDSPLPPGGIDTPYTSVALVVGGLPPYTITVTNGAVPEGMSLDATTGVLSGTPIAPGSFSFTVEAEDSAADNLRATFALEVFGVEPTATVTNETPTATSTPTETATAEVTETATAVATETPTAPAGICMGNCNGDNAVTINELITLVGIALGQREPSACPDGIPAGASVNIALLVRAVGNALNGCEAS